MYSPQDRIYTTPDVSVPSVNAIMQHLKLESLLRKVGHLHDPNAIPPSYRPQLPILPAVQPANKQTIRPFDRYPGTKPDNSCNSCTKPQQESDRRPIFIPLQTIRTLGNARFGTHDVPMLDLIQRRRAHNHATEKCPRHECHPPEIYKPFPAHKSPRRLPAIKGEKPKDIKPSMHIGRNPNMTYIDIAHEDLVANANMATRRRSAHLSQEKKKRKIRIQRELEFREWQDTQNVHKKLQSFESKFDQEILASQERFHEIAEQTNEQIYRKKICTDIQQGVQKKLDSFREGKTRDDEGATSYRARDDQGAASYRARDDKGATSYRARDDKGATIYRARDDEGALSYRVTTLSFGENTKQPAARKIVNDGLMIRKHKRKKKTGG